MWEKNHLVCIVHMKHTGRDSLKKISGLCTDRLGMHSYAPAPEAPDYWRSGILGKYHNVGAQYCALYSQGVCSPNNIVPPGSR